jgi:lipopolysaccharide export system permease protein
MLVVRYIGRRVVGAFVGVFLAALVVVLGIEFADHAHHYSGPGWVSAVVVLYACKAAVMGYQLAPAALLIGVELAIASLKRRGELTAMRALGFSPWFAIRPCLTVGTGLAILLFAANESFVGRASRRADEITTGRFSVWGDYSTWFGQRRWFRSGRTIYFLRDARPDGAYGNVSVFELTADFRLKRRLDAKSIEPLPDGRWRVVDGVLRSMVDAGDSRVENLTAADLRLDEPARSFAVHAGRPDQLRFAELRNEIAERRQIGLRDGPYVVALQGKLTHPLMAIPFALVGAALSLRPRRRDAPAVAMVEGLGAVAVLWIGDVMVQAASLGGRLAPWAGPWLLIGLACLGAALLARAALSR